MGTDLLRSFESSPLLGLLTAGPRLLLQTLEGARLILPPYDAEDDGLVGLNALLTTPFSDRLGGTRDPSSVAAPESESSADLDGFSDAGSVVSMDVADPRKPAKGSAAAGRRQLGARRGPRAVSQSSQNQQQPTSSRRVSSSRPLGSSGHTRAAWRRWSRTAAALAPMLRLEAACRIRRRIEALEHGLGKWLAARAVTISLRARAERLSVGRPTWLQRHGLEVLRRNALFFRCCAIGRVRAATWQLQLALHSWHAGARIWTNQRLHVNVQTTECVRCALRWWSRVVDEYRIHDLALQVGVQRSATNACIRAIEKWQSWLALEEVFISRGLYRETEVLQEMLGRWREATAVYLAVHAFRVRKAPGSRPLTPMPSMPGSAASSRPASRPVSRPSSPSTSPPTAPIMIPWHYHPTSRRSSIAAMASDTDAFERELSPRSALRYLHYAPARQLFDRWARRSIQQAREEQFADDVKWRRAAAALSALHEAARTGLEVAEAADAVRAARVFILRQACFQLWSDVASRLAHAWQMATQGQEAFRRRETAMLSVAWDALHCLLDRGRTHESHTEVSNVFAARGSKRAAMKVWRAEVDRRALSAEATARAMIWQHGAGFALPLEAACLRVEARD